MIGHENGIWTVCYVGNNMIASAAADQFIKIWDLNTNECKTTFEAHKDQVRKIINIDEGRFASCSNDGYIKVWNS